MVLEEGRIQDMMANLKSFLGSENIELMQNITAALKDIATLNKGERQAAISNLSVAFTAFVNKEKAIIRNAIHNFDDPKKRAAGLRAFGRLSIDLLKLLGIGAFVLAPIPGTGPLLVIVVHVILSKLTGGRVGLIPNSTFKMFKQYQAMKQFDAEDKQKKTFKEFA